MHTRVRILKESLPCFCSGNVDQQTIARPHSSTSIMFPPLITTLAPANSDRIDFLVGTGSAPTLAVGRGALETVGGPRFAAESWVFPIAQAADTTLPG